MDIANTIERLSIALIPMLLGIILHEVAHGFVAYRLGDRTAYMQGRLTLNPSSHIDPMGAMVFIFSSLFTPFAFGWAKPVPVNPRYFKEVRRDLLLVALAGPMANIFLAVLFAVFIRFGLEIGFFTGSPSGMQLFFAKVFFAGVSINLTLAFFNLLPIPPLDGSKIVASLLPPHIALTYERYEQYGFFILLLLMVLGLFQFILYPFIAFSASFLFSLVGII
ncbi:MAG: site-2 protease family protein [Desulfovibrionaceae bacterium]